MNEKSKFLPDSTAVRVALWRALHVLSDAPPHVLVDTVGLQLVAPEEGWQQRPDMHPQGTAAFRASIVARARFIENFVISQYKLGVNQYVLLGAGLDTFAQRHTDIATQMQIFEVEKPETQAWKQERLAELGLPLPAGLHFVPVNFETSESWWKQLSAAGFELQKPAVVTSIGVSMYLTMDAIKETLRQIANLASGSQFIMTFMLPLELVAPADQLGYQMSLKGAQKSGTPFISFFTPPEMLTLAREAGFKKVDHLSTSDLPYFAGRSDGLKPSTGEVLLIATT